MEERNKKYDTGEVFWSKDARKKRDVSDDEEWEEFKVILCVQYFNSEDLLSYILLHCRKNTTNTTKVMKTVNVERFTFKLKPKLKKIIGSMKLVK